MRLLKVSGLTLLVLIQIIQAAFDPSRMNFGADWDYLNKNKTGSVAGAIDYATIWLNDPSFNQYWHGDLLKFCQSTGATPVFYAYIVAKLSKLGDSDTGGKLDQEGGKWLKNNISKVLGVYENYAQATAAKYGTTKPVIWLMEPDYYQYCNGNGNDISVGEAANYMKQMISSVKKHLPNALFSLDISPWNNNQSSYIRSFDMSLFSFMHTSGGRTEAGNNRIRNDNNNNVTWRDVNSASGKCIIADIGYGHGGGDTGHGGAWDDVNNLKARIGDGVAAITQKAPKNDWGSTISKLKSSLSGNKTKCGDIIGPIEYTLSTTPSVGGSIKKSPDKASYKEGETVTLTATAQSGYKFAGWSGAATGTNPTATVKMDKDKSVGAEFIQDNGKPKYTLTVNVTGSGIVKIDPETSLYDEGTTVTLEAFSVNSGVFQGWGGALSGTIGIQKIVMNSNKTVSASFTGNKVEPAVNLIKNGDFSDGESGWEFGAYEKADATGEVENGIFKVAIASSGTAAWQIQLMQSDISLTQGEKYVLSFTASSPNSTAITVNVGMPVDPFTSYSRSLKKQLTPQDTKFEIPFTMTKASTSEARLEFNAGLSSGSWKIDNVELSRALAISVNDAVKPAHRHLKGLDGFGANERVTISWYDHAGRLINTISGDYQTLSSQHATMQRSGTYITTLQVGNRTIVKRGVQFIK